MVDKKYEDDGFGVTLTCPVCGKEFWVSSLALYTYKKGYANSVSKYYCGYKCFRKDGN